MTQPPDERVAIVRAVVADLRRLRAHHEFTRDRIGQSGCPVRVQAAEFVETIDRAIDHLSEQGEG